MVYIYDGDIGWNGDVVFGFESVGDGIYILDEISVDVDLIEDLLGGEWYVNVYIEIFLDGEFCG